MSIENDNQPGLVSAEIIGDGKSALLSFRQDGIDMIVRFTVPTRPLIKRVPFDTPESE